MILANSDEQPGVEDANHNISHNPYQQFCVETRDRAASRPYMELVEFIYDKSSSAIADHGRPRTSLRDSASTTLPVELYETMEEEQMPRCTCRNNRRASDKEETDLKLFTDQTVQSHSTRNDTQGLSRWNSSTATSIPCMHERRSSAADVGSMSPVLPQRAVRQHRSTVCDVIRIHPKILDEMPEIANTGSRLPDLRTSGTSDTTDPPPLPKRLAKRSPYNPADIKCPERSTQKNDLHGKMRSTTTTERLGFEPDSINENSERNTKPVQSSLRNWMGNLQDEVVGLRSENDRLTKSVIQLSDQMKFLLSFLGLSNAHTLPENIPVLERTRPNRKGRY